MSESGRRGVPARIGIAALNLLAPGLGLLRLQRPKPAIMFLVAPFVLLGLIFLVYRATDKIDFAAWVALVGVSLAVAAAIYVGAIAMSWRASAVVGPPGPWWSRWYGLVAVLLLAWLANWLLPDATRGSYKTFYIPSEAMSPTLLKDDRLLASMRGAGALRRGDIVLLDVGRFSYIKRVAALPGDRIEMRDGLVILNGRPVAQRYLRTDRVAPSGFGTEARRLAEQFPGEASPHQIYDLGYSQGDDMAEQRVRPGHVFVLGDNRDQSLDSRYSRAEMGVEQLPIADIRGRALFYLWGPSQRMGKPLNR